MGRNCVDMHHFNPWTLTIVLTTSNEISSILFESTRITKMRDNTLNKNRYKSVQYVNPIYLSTFCAINQFHPHHQDEGTVQTHGKSHKIFPVNTHAVTSFHQAVIESCLFSLQVVSINVRFICIVINFSLAIIGRLT